MSPSNRLDTFVELEEKLSVLRVHYELCPELKPKEVLDWAKFFLQWSRVLGEIGSPRCKTNFLKTSKLVMDLAGVKAGFNPYEALETAMEEAQKVIQEEIFDFTKPQKMARIS